MHHDISPPSFLPPPPFTGLCGGPKAAGARLWKSSSWWKSTSVSPKCFPVRGLTEIMGGEGSCSVLVACARLHCSVQMLTARRMTQEWLWRSTHSSNPFTPLRSAAAMKHMKLPKNLKGNMDPRSMQVRVGVLVATRVLCCGGSHDAWHGDAYWPQ